MYGPPPRHSARRRRASVEQPTQLAAVVLQIFVQGVDGKPNKLIESYKFEITYVDGLAQVRVSEEETGRSLAPKVEQTSVETMKRTFQVVRSSPRRSVASDRYATLPPLRMIRLQVAIRSLIQLTSTFDALPERFSVNLQLRYTDGKRRLTFKLSRSKLSAALAGTPEEYQPEYFRELKEEDKLKFVKKPYHLSVRCNCSATVQWPRCTVLCIVRFAPTTQVCRCLSDVAGCLRIAPCFLMCPQHAGHCAQHTRYLVALLLRRAEQDRRVQQDQGCGRSCDGNRGAARVAAGLRQFGPERLRKAPLGENLD